MSKHTLRGSLLLLLTAFIWGSSFVAQSVGMERVGPFTYNAIRLLMGGLVLLPVVFWMRRGKQIAPETRRATLRGGLLCGAVLFAASSLQQIGIADTTAGKAGFITALYIVFVPLTGLLFGKRLQGRVWLAVAVAVLGMYLLCVKDNFTVSRGDLYVLACAFFYTLHILLIDAYARRVDGVMMSAIQFLAASVPSAVCMLIWETPRLPDIAAIAWPLVYSGVFSCGVAYTLQIIAQKDASPAMASLLMSLESVFAALSGYLLLGETLSVRELIGCALMFGAILLAQFPRRERGAV